MRELVGGYIEHLGFSKAFHKHPELTKPLVQVLCFGFLIYFMTRMFKYIYYSLQTKGPFQFIPFEFDFKNKDVVVVDSTHSNSPTITHHKGGKNPQGLQPSDTSTGLVLNAIQTGYIFGGQVYKICQSRYVTTNHFDIDSFLAVFCYINRKLAIQYESVLRHMARIGDFREAFLSPELVTTYGVLDGITSIRDAFTALKLCCWLNTVERREFSAPYVARDCVRKMEYFLHRFGDVLQDHEAHWRDWQYEYSKVVAAFDVLHSPASTIERYEEIGLAVVTTAEPQHYYSLFSNTIGLDVVLCMYSNNCYEVECKYSQYVCIHSRPVWPRLDMGLLAQVLNELEEGQDGSIKWTANRFTDTGPLLRLDHPSHPLTKAERYGNPTDRPIHPSTIHPLKMSAIVVSFLEYGLQAHGLRPRVGGWSWEELHAINKVISWGPWLDTCRREHLLGNLKLPADLKPESGRRLSNDLLDAEPTSPPVSNLAQPSAILSPADVQTIKASLPGMQQLNRWKLLYSTAQHGISLKTLYRNAGHAHPTLLVVKDTGGAVFGAFAPEQWRIHPRFYGTGETFVFSLHPTPAVHHWRPPSPGQDRNDFFQFSEPEGLGVGGAGHWAIRLDGDLLTGSSGSCFTFSSPCLASSEEFRVHTVELWNLG